MHVSTLTRNELQNIIAYHREMMTTVNDPADTAYREKRIAELEQLIADGRYADAI